MSKNIEPLIWGKVSQGKNDRNEKNEVEWLDIDCETPVYINFLLLFFGNIWSGNCIDKNVILNNSKI